MVRPDAVAIYIRWSTEEQTEGTTLETQRERCSWYLKSQGWEVNPNLIFVDDGHSGASLDRPALRRLREAVRGGQVDCVVSYSLDRLSRSVADTVQLVQEEWLGRCIYRSASQPISTDEGNPTGQLIFNILASFAEFERALIRERTHNGMVRRAKEGRFPGCRVAPYGYRRDGVGRLAIDSVAADGTLQGPAAVVRRIFELAATGPYGQGPTVIARTLVQEGIPGPTGKPWLAPTVREILRNPAYVGDLVYGREKVNPARKRDRSAPERLPREQPLARVSGALPAIVPRELWDRVQALAAERPQTGAKLPARNRALLSGLARCKCGGPMAVYYDRHGKRYYRCNRNTMSGAGCQHRPGVFAADALESVVVKAVRERYGTEALRQAAIRDAEDVLLQGRHVKQVRHAIRQAEARLAEIDQDVARVRRAALRGEIQPATFEELRAEAERERVGLHKQVEELQARLASQEDTAASLAVWKAVVDQVDVWESLEPTRQREVLNGLLRAIQVYRPRRSNLAPEIDLVWEQPIREQSV